MKRNKELFFNLSISGKRVSMKVFRDKPVDYDLFKDIISELKNVNLGNKIWLDNFYNKYIDIFFNIVKEHVNSYSKYFWNNSCLELNSNSVSDEYWLQRGWSNDELNKKRKDRYATGTITFQKAKYALNEEDAIKKLKDRQTIIKSKRKKTYKKYLKADPDYFKKKCGYSVDHFIDKGFTKDESINLSNDVAFKVSKNNKQWAKEQKFKNPNYWSSRTETQLEYWIAKGYSEESAKQKLKERQTTFSKKICIEKYGEVEGLRIFKDRQEKWKKKVFNDKQWLGGGVSKVSNDLFEQIIKLSKLKSLNCLFGYKNEKHIRDKNSKRTYKYDFTYLPTKKIIEFNGDYWHCNLELYENKYYHKIKDMNAQQIWDYDNTKISLAKKYGYDVLVIWEKEYRNNPEEIVNKCINFIIN
jgi:hypothetical protein